VTLTAVVALTLAACTSNTTDTREWSDEAFGDLMTYCQATEKFSNCSGLLIGRRDTDQCSVEATYRIIDHLAAADSVTERLEAFNDLVNDVLIPAGDCLGLDE